MGPNQIIPQSPLGMPFFPRSNCLQNKTRTIQHDSQGWPQTTFLGSTLHNCSRVVWNPTQPGVQSDQWQPQVYLCYSSHQRRPYTSFLIVSTLIPAPCTGIIDTLYSQCHQLQVLKAVGPDTELRMQTVFEKQHLKGKGRKQDQTEETATKEMPI